MAKQQAEGFWSGDDEQTLSKQHFHSRWLQTYLTAADRVIYADEISFSLEVACLLPRRGPAEGDYRLSNTVHSSYQSITMKNPIPYMLSSISL